MASAVRGRATLQGGCEGCCAVSVSARGHGIGYLLGYCGHDVDIHQENSLGRQRMLQRRDCVWKGSMVLDTPFPVECRRTIDSYDDNSLGWQSRLLGVEHDIG